VSNLDGISPWLDKNGHILVADGGGEGNLVIDSSNDLLFHGDDVTELSILFHRKLLAGFSFSLLEHIIVQKVLQG
jgi:hypothetical protein